MKAHDRVMYGGSVLLVGAAIVAAVFAPERVEALLTPTPRTLLVAVEMGTGARRSIASYPSEDGCADAMVRLNVVAEDNGRTERATCDAPVEP